MVSNICLIYKTYLDRILEIINYSVIQKYKEYSIHNYLVHDSSQKNNARLNQFIVEGKSKPLDGIL